MDLRAYYGVNNYWEPIEDNYINSYPNNISMEMGFKKVTYFYGFVSRIMAHIQNFIKWIIKIFRTKKIRSRDYYFEKCLYEN